MEKDRKSMMMTLVSGGIFIICVIALLLAKAPERTQEEPVKDKTQEKDYGYVPIMYKICNNDTCNYLLTSIYKGDNKVNIYNKVVLDAYNEMDEFASLYDVTKASNVDMMEYVGSNKLDSVISNELKTKLTKFFEKNNFPYAAMAILPVGAVVLGVIDQIYSEAELTQKSPAEYFYYKASNDGKTMNAFEEIDLQEDVLKNYSVDYCIEELEKLINSYENKVVSVEELYDSYLSADESKIIGYLEEDPIYEFEKKYNNDLYYKRNSAIVEKIEEFLAHNKKVFIVLDITHVLGKNGIIDLLSNSNYDISLVK